LFVTGVIGSFSQAQVMQFCWQQFFVWFTLGIGIVSLAAGTCPFGPESGEFHSCLTLALASVAIVLSPLGLLSAVNLKLDTGSSKLVLQAVSWLHPNHTDEASGRRCLLQNLLRTIVLDSSAVSPMVKLGRRRKASTTPLFNSSKKFMTSTLTNASSFALQLLLTLTVQDSYCPNLDLLD
jgi:hypothetical protein